MADSPAARVALAAVGPGVAELEEGGGRRRLGHPQLNARDNVAKALVAEAGVVGVPRIACLEALCVSFAVHVARYASGVLLQDMCLLPDVARQCA